MNATDTLTKQPATKSDSRTGTTTSLGTPGTSQSQQPRTYDAPTHTATHPGGVGIAFAIAAVIAVGALVWAVATGPTDTSFDPSAHDQVEANRVATLRDLATQPADSYDRVEANRVATLRDLATQPADSYDRVEANRAATLRDLATHSG